MHRLAILLAALVILSVSCAVKKNVVLPDEPADTDVVEKIDPALSQRMDLDMNKLQLPAHEQKVLEGVQVMNFKIDHYARREIQREFIFLHHTVPHRVREWLKRSERYLAGLKRVLNEHGLPEELAYLPLIESGYSTKACSPMGASGIWQFMPYTGERYGLSRNYWIDERRDPLMATAAACEYLGKLYQIFGDWGLALAAYNAGEGKIGRAIAIAGSRDFFHLSQNNHRLDDFAQLRPETLSYVPRFIAAVQLVKNHEVLGYDPLHIQPEPDLKTLQARPDTDLRNLARACNLDWETFREYNLSFCRNSTPSDRYVTVRVPAHQVERAKVYLSSSQAVCSKSDMTRLTQVNRLLVKAEKKGISLKKAVGKKKELVKILIKSKNSRQSEAVVSAKFVQPQAIATVATSVAQPIQYTAGNGDTVNVLAKYFKVTEDGLFKFNRFKLANDLHAGRLLYLPGKTLSGRTVAVTMAPLATQVQTKTKALARTMDTSSIISTPMIVQAASEVTKPVADLTKFSTSSYISTSAPAKLTGKKATAYQIKGGDTIWSIAKKLAVSPDSLMQCNKLNKSTILRPGVVLVYNN
ncbi:membrane-bound lytic murein transglycosylase D [Desulfovibrionales bacterium]